MNRSLIGALSALFLNQQLRLSFFGGGGLIFIGALLGMRSARREAGALKPVGVEEA